MGNILRKQNISANCVSFNAETNVKLTTLTLPPHGMSRLVLIMVRHVTVVLSYVIMTSTYSILRQIFGYGIDLSNPLNIMINLLIYMIFPIGDSIYNSCCVCATKYCFFCWYDRYTKHQEELIGQLASQHYKNIDCDSWTQQEEITLQIAPEKKTETDSYDAIEQNQRFEVVSETTKTARDSVEREMTNLGSLLPHFSDNLLF